MPFLLIFYFIASSWMRQSSTPEVWYVKSNSQLTVNGATNINTFSCVVPSYGKADTLIFYKDGIISTQTKVNCILHIPVNAFDCGNRFMTKDLQKTMKSDQFPYMVIDIKTLSDLQNNVGQTIQGKAEIMIAGIKKQFIIPFAITKKDHYYYLKGKKQVLFSDFKLHPPSKLGGSIKVKDELDVEVNLVLVKG